MSEQEKSPETEGVETEAQQAPEVDPIEKLETENAQLRDRMLRTAAEMENLRKRTEREISDVRAYSIASFARDMLAASDNLNRALGAVPEEARESAEGTLKSLIEGIEMTEREMQRLLQKHGISEIEAEGQKFDPHRHQAMFEVPDPAVPEGTVVQVVQTGYAIGERVLRPAMVGVSKGGPKHGGTLGPDGAEAESKAGDNGTGEGVDKTA